MDQNKIVMSFKDYTSEVQEKFHFLVSEHGFRLVELREEGYGTFLIYRKDRHAIYLGYEFREERFFYYLNDSSKQVAFWQFFQRFDPALQWIDLMPKGDNYSEAISKNVEMLKQYGDGFLKGSQNL